MHKKSIVIGCRLGLKPEWDRPIYCHAFKGVTINAKLDWALAP